MSVLATFTGGEADGQILEFARVPRYLRVERGVDGKWDVLDQLEDAPGLGAELFVYRVVPGATGHICGRPRRGGRGGGCMTMITYEHTDAIDPVGIDDFDVWRARVEAACRAEEAPLHVVDD